ncbi:MAG: hypothetical protein EOM50_07645 [Erysipelotrichia bacterium]|nr:hypothetical protein [Erysipelotrichia bacterium]
MLTPNKDPEFDSSQIIEVLRTNIDEVGHRSLSRLTTLLEHADPVELFVATLTSIMFGKPEEMTESNYGTVSIKSELLAYELYPYFGNSNASNKIIDVDSTTLKKGDIEECQMLLEDLLLSYSGKSLIDSQENKDSLLGSICGRAKIVRGNAYPPQTERRIREVQGRFDDWFAQQVGIAPTKAVDILSTILQVEENAVIEIANNTCPIVHSKHLKKTTSCNRSKKSIKSHIIKKFDISFGATSFIHVPVHRLKATPTCTEEEWNALISLIGLTTEKRTQITNQIEIRNHPLYVLPDGRVLLIDISNAFDVLWETYDKIARQNQNFYDKRYQKYAAKWLEDRVVGYLSHLFPDGQVYRTLDYPDPNNIAGGTAELDAAVVWGPFLLLVEVKAKQFRLEGQLGDIGRLRTDLKQNIEDAFNQALRARKYIESVDQPVLKERGTNRELYLNKNKLHRIYHLTVSLHGFATLTTRLMALTPLGLFKGNEYPFAISESDLEIVSEFFPGPEVFLHYIEKRIELHQVSPEVSADEIDLIGAYLDTRFVNGQLWDNSNNSFNMFALDGYSDEIDRWARYHWVGTEELPKVCLEVPEAIMILLSYLRIQPQEDARWIAFCILDLPSPALNALAEGLELARNQPPTFGKFRRFVSAANDLVICIVVSNGHRPEELKANIEKRIAIEKYRRRVRKAIGFGIVVEDNNLITVAILQDNHWEKDPQLELLVQNDIPGILLPGTKIPGRNDPCLCGSGKKYKKCCLQKYE